MCTSGEGRGGDHVIGEPAVVSGEWTAVLSLQLSTILGFLWINKKELGSDPTVITASDQRFIEIERNSVIERLVIDGMMNRAYCIAGRATTCWKAHHKRESQTPLVIKDLY